MDWWSSNGVASLRSVFIALMEAQSRTTEKPFSICERARAPFRIDYDVMRIQLVALLSIQVGDPQAALAHPSLVLLAQRMAASATVTSAGQFLAKAVHAIYTRDHAIAPVDVGLVRVCSGLLAAFKAYGQSAPRHHFHLQWLTHWCTQSYGVADR